MLARLPLGLVCSTISSDGSKWSWACRRPSTAKKAESLPRGWPKNFYQQKPWHSSTSSSTHNELWAYRSCDHGKRISLTSYDYMIADVEVYALQQAL
ncbi:hypothetical protein FA10DRAFT_199953 [Acaromyces ingoldii]|uniref:Uncharacterized protein n=1 Tax=Acaromyces ingoldii TaxID=215250 RepID=A0A316YB50_9BASI|nr:hypothetical protein FA10DRAFT_199953 [Acaromyces ingoldii]PWN86787.1 hypothetical protein FA10DRAFT_199953 [Acaromyces ingoldii]